jgi:hypothetical protein
VEHGRDLGLLGSDKLGAGVGNGKGCKAWTEGYFGKSIENVHVKIFGSLASRRTREINILIQ